MEDPYTQTCENCGSQKRLYKLNFQEAILLCENKECSDLFLTTDVSKLIFPCDSTYKSTGKTKKKIQTAGNPIIKESMSLNSTSSVSISQHEDSRSVFTVSNTSANVNEFGIPTIPVNSSLIIDGMPVTRHLNFATSNACIPVTINSNQTQSLECTRQAIPTTTASTNGENSNLANRFVAEQMAASQIIMIDNKPYMIRSSGEFVIGNRNEFVGSYRLQVPEDSGTKYPQWCNKDSLCWLDVTLNLLMHNSIVRQLLSRLPDDSVVKQLVNRYDEVVLLLNNKSSDVKNLAINASKLEDVMILLEKIRDIAFAHLQQKLKCNRGEEESPVFALPFLLKEELLMKTFLNHYQQIFKCDFCKFQQTRSVQKMVLTIDRVPDDFAMPNARYVAKCFKCGADNQEHEVKFERLQPCVVIHFVNGLPAEDWARYDFHFQGVLYTVRGVIQYKRNPNHFIAWIRNKEDEWMECDDLKNGPTSFQNSRIPRMLCYECHIVVWEQVAPSSSATLHDKINILSEIDVPSLRTECENVPIYGDHLYCSPSKNDFADSIDDSRTSFSTFENAQTECKLKTPDGNKLGIDIQQNETVIDTIKLPVSNLAISASGHFETNCKGDQLVSTVSSSNNTWRKNDTQCDISVEVPTCILDVQGDNLFNISNCNQESVSELKAVAKPDSDAHSYISSEVKTVLDKNQLISDAQNSIGTLKNGEILNQSVECETPVTAVDMTEFNPAGTDLDLQDFNAESKTMMAESFNQNHCQTEPAEPSSIVERKSDLTFAQCTHLNGSETNESQLSDKFQPQNYLPASLISNATNNRNGNEQFPAINSNLDNMPDNRNGCLPSGTELDDLLKNKDFNCVLIVMPTSQAGDKTTQLHLSNESAVQILKQYGQPVKTIVVPNTGSIQSQLTVNVNVPSTASKNPAAMLKTPSNQLSQMLDPKEILKKQLASKLLPHTNGFEDLMPKNSRFGGRCTIDPSIGQGNGDDVCTSNFLELDEDSVEASKPNTRYRGRGRGRWCSRKAATSTIAAPRGSNARGQRGRSGRGRGKNVAKTAVSNTQTCTTLESERTLTLSTTNSFDLTDSSIFLSNTNNKSIVSQKMQLLSEVCGMKKVPLHDTAKRKSRNSQYLNVTKKSKNFEGYHIKSQQT